MLAVRWGSTSPLCQLQGRAACSRLSTAPASSGGGVGKHGDASLASVSGGSTPTIKRECTDAVLQLSCNQRGTVEVIAYHFLLSKGSQDLRAV